MNTMMIEGKPVSLKGFSDRLEAMKVGEKLTIDPIGRGWTLVAERVAMTAEENCGDDVPAEGWIFVGKGGSIWDETGEGFTWANYRPDASGKFGHNAVYLQARYAYFSIKRWWKQDGAS